MNRLFYTTGNQDILETEYKLPDLSAEDVIVKSIYTGVCRSDVAMYNGDFQLLPKEIQGHECLGEVVEVGNKFHSIKVGDIVATRGEPGFADKYIAKWGTFVKVPEVSPKYIIEPVACGVNIVDNYLRMWIGQDNVFFNRKKYLIIGTGFLAQVIYKTLEFGLKRKCNVYVVGNSNKEFWENTDVTMLRDIDLEEGSYVFDAVFDIKDDPKYINDLYLLKPNGVHLICAEKTEDINITSSKYLWENNKILFPSPRDINFINGMELAVELVKDGTIDTENLWSKSYKRDTEVEQAFKDANDRTKQYTRGYIEWER